MNQPQLPLPLTKKDTFSFNEFFSNEEVVNALSQYEQLPQFTFMWGAQHSGKSHLIAALAASLDAANEDFLMLDAAMLTDDDLVNNLPAQLSFLLIDDIDVIAGEVNTELSLFNLYNFCLASHCKLVVSSSVPPRSDGWVLPDLKSRLNSGLALSLEVLKGDLALQCIEHQFELSGIPLEPAVIKYLKTTQNTSFANLYQLFVQLSAETLKLKRKLTVPLIKKALEDNQESVQ